MFKFLHQLFNPHCQHCIDERREQREDNRYCASCEVLALENARLVRDNERLLNSLLNKPIETTQKINSVTDLKPINTTKTPFIPSAVRRQILEREDRHTAQLQADAPKRDINIAEESAALSKELDDVRAAREQETGTRQAS